MTISSNLQPQQQPSPPQPISTANTFIGGVGGGGGVSNGSSSHHHQSSSSASTSTNPSDSISALIDTFTATVNDQPLASSNGLATYQVKSEIGTLIAQKLFKGDQIRVGVNGEATSAATRAAAEQQDRSESR